MDHYARFSRNTIQFLALTGYTLEEFHALLPIFRACFLERMETYTLKGEKRAHRRYVEYRNSPLVSMEDKLVFILMYLRKGTTQDIFGEVFNMSQPIANKWIHILHPCLSQALAELGERPARSVSKLKFAAAKGLLFFQDGTERPIERPKNAEKQRQYYSGKKKRHCIKNNVLINRQAKILLLTPTDPGTKHDKKIADEACLVLPVGSRLCQDTGFQGYTLAGVTIIQPMKKPRKKELSPDQKNSTARSLSCASVWNMPLAVSSGIEL